MLSTLPTPVRAQLLLLAALRAGRLRTAASRDNTPLHRAADKHYSQMMLVISAAFMRGKKAYKSSGVDAAVKAIRASLLESLPAVLLASLVAGGRTIQLPGLKAAELRTLVTPIAMKFDASDPRAAAWAKQHAAELATGISDTTRQAIKDAIARQAETGETAYDDIRNAVGDDARAEMIARTECLPGETLVDAAVVGAVHRRRYDGHVVEVITRNGRQFSATANHPMLTKRGWLGAGEIREGDYLVCDDRDERSRPSRDKDVAGVPATLAQLFDAASLVGIVERKRGTVDDFHGDGIDGDVDTARPFWPLVIGNFSPLYKPIVDQFLAPADEPRAPLCLECGCLLSIHEPVCFCHSAKSRAVLSQNALYDVCVDSECEAQPLHRFAGQVTLRDNVGRDADISVMHGAAALEEIGTSICERSNDPSLSYHVKRPVVGAPNLLGDERAAQSGKIELDDVVSVTVRPFSGHVYNLSTPFGYFTIKGTGSKGKIFTGNTMAAANEGQRQAWDQAVDDGLLTGDERREWIATEDACPECEALDGALADLDGEYPDEGGGGPPLHPNCRCTEGISAMRGAQDHYDPSEARDERGQWTAGGAGNVADVRAALAQMPEGSQIVVGAAETLTATSGGWQSASGAMTHADAAGQVVVLAQNGMLPGSAPLTLAQQTSLAADLLKKAKKNASRTPLLAFAIGAGADWASTARFMSQGDKEANPLINWAKTPAQTIALGAGLDAVGAWGWMKMTQDHTKVQAVGFYVATALRGYLVIHNLLPTKYADGTLVRPRGAR